jgi:signal peptidase I
MVSYRRWSLAFFSGCLLILLAAVWDNFAPLPLGGQAAYVIINGNSMEPGFHLGDLVIVRPERSYAVGDEVSYRDADLGRYVFHRIVGQDLERYILKGDHNTWIDSYHPTNAEVVGKAWIHLPGFGKAIQWLRTPIVLAAIAGASGAIAMVVLLVQPNKKKAWKNR